MKRHFAVASRRMPTKKTFEQNLAGQPAERKMRAKRKRKESSIQFSWRTTFLTELVYLQHANQGDDSFCDKLTRIGHI
jgi:hypothetical protein